MQFLTTTSLPLNSNPFIDRFMEGGPLFMSLILICLILSIVFLIMGFRSISDNPEKTRKMISLSGDAGLLGLVLGFLGSFIGMITAFDAIEGFDEMNASIIAGGLKVSFLTTLFGLLVFLISRTGILVLKWKLK